MILSNKFLHPQMLSRYRVMALFGGAKHDHDHCHHETTEHHDHHDHGHGHHHVKRSRPPVEYNTISAMLDHQNLTTYFETGPGYMKYPGVHYYEHHHDEYDWRDDPKRNSDITLSTRHRGVPDPKTYVWPFEGRNGGDNPALKVPVDHLYSPNLILRSDNQKTLAPQPHLKAGEWEPQSEINHEYEYESEDLDFQTDSFRTQHFRKKGPLTGWVLCALCPFIYVWAEFFYQHYPDEDHWRITKTPPLNYPDTEDTDDTDTYNDYHKPEGRFLRDAGIVGDLWFDIKDGKKVYDRWAGVNQPMEDI